jgi:predicted DsbA family dithiol-disulfide isomerase
LFVGRHIDIAQMLDRMESSARAAGLPFTRREKTYNSRRAQELGKWAESHSKGEAFHFAVFHAYFALGLNIHRLENLATIAESVGLDSRRAREIIRDRRFGDEVDADWRRSVESGIRAVPTLVVGGNRLIGARSLQSMADFLHRNHIQKRP